MARNTEKSSKSEYDRIRDNILRQRRYFKSQGYKVPNIPLTPKQAGFDTKEIKGYQWADRIKGLREYEKNLQESIQYQRKTKGIEYAPYNKVKLSNYLKNLDTKGYGKGASKVKEWFQSTLEKVGEERMVEVIEEAENSGVQVDRYVKYDDETAIKYIGDMTNFFYDKGYVDKNQSYDILSEVAGANDYYSNFFETILEDMI